MAMYLANVPVYTRLNADAFVTLVHWTFTENELPPGSPQFLWRNNGDGSFTDVSDETMMSSAAIDRPSSSRRSSCERKGSGRNQR